MNVQRVWEGKSLSRKGSAQNRHTRAQFTPVISYTLILQFLNFYIFEAKRLTVTSNFDSRLHDICSQVRAIHGHMSTRNQIKRNYLDAECPFLAATVWDFETCPQTLVNKNLSSNSSETKTCPQTLVKQKLVLKL